MNYVKLPAVEGGRGGCACCGYQHSILEMDALIAVGFGDASVTKNDETVYQENPEDDEFKFWRCQDAENEALKEPDNDWRIHLVAPLSERHYQRQGEGHWVLYKKGEGFA